MKRVAAGKLTSCWRAFFLYALILSTLLQASAARGLESIEVTTGADAGPGSLRQAILEAKGARDWMSSASIQPEAPSPHPRP